MYILFLERFYSLYRPPAETRQKLVQNTKICHVQYKKKQKRHAVENEELYVTVLCNRKLCASLLHAVASLLTNFSSRFIRNLERICLFCLLFSIYLFILCWTLFLSVC